MRRIVISITLLLAAALFAHGADSADDAEARRAAPPLPRTFGDGNTVIRISANQIVRRSVESLWVLELGGNVRLQQGDDVITATRLIAWFHESGREGSKVGLLDVYGEADAVLPGGGKRVETGGRVFVRLASSTGLVLKGNIVPEDNSKSAEELYARANMYRTSGIEAVEQLASDQRLLKVIHPSAREMIIEQADDNRTIITLHGNARIVYEDMALSADTLRARIYSEGENFETTRLESIYAEGVVEVVQGTDRITSDALILDMRSQEALATGTRIRTHDQGSGLPLQFYADTIRQKDPNTFEAEGRGYVAASAFAVPHYRMEGRNIRLVRRPATGDAAEGEKPPERMVVSSRHNTLYVGPVPIFYWPYLARDLSSDTFVLESAEAGTSSNLGAFTKLEWNLYDLGIVSDDNSELLLRTDYFSDRGAGVGINFSYEELERWGFARAYYINDTAEEDDRNLPTPQNNRGEVALQHREFLTCLPQDWHLDFELGYLSDRQFLRTYDRAGYDEEKDRETKVFLTGVSGNQMMMAQARVRVNDFQNTVDRQALTYHIIGQPLPGSRFLMTSHVDLANMKRRVDNDLPMRDGESVRRLDAATELSHPVQLGLVRLDPYLWGDVTAYSNQMDGGSTVRTATALGARAATNFYRTCYVRNEGLGVNRLRHVITPTVDYRNQWAVSENPENFYQGDEIDALDEFHRLAAGLRNRLQTYRPNSGDRPVDFATLDIDYVSYLRNSGRDRGMDNYVELSATWLATEKITFTSNDNRYNVDEGRLEALNTEVAFTFEPPISLTIGNKYYVDLDEPAEPSHWVSMLNVGFEPKFSRWRVDTYMTYDFDPYDSPEDTKDPSQLGSGIRFTRDIDGWLIAIGTEFHQGKASETRLSLDITPPTRRR